MGIHGRFASSVGGAGRRCHELVATVAMMTAVACGGGGSFQEDVSSAATAAKAPAEIFVVRSDARLCPSPACGGFFVSAVNRRSTRCLGGGSRAECYVSSLDLAALALSPEEEASLRGAIGASAQEARVVLRGSIGADPGNAYGRFVATSAWQAPAPGVVSGTFFGVRANGIVCVTYPCPSIDETVLNAGTTRTIHEVDLSKAPGDALAKDAAMQDIFDGDGLLAAGANVVVKDAGPAGDAVVLSASQFFSLVKPKPPPPPEPCGSSTCGAGEYCCNPSCSICAPLGGGCVLTVCDPTPDPVTCGASTCGAGEYCCNPSCGTCAPLGAACLQVICDPPPPPEPCGPHTCAVGEVCCNWSCGICTPPGAYCIQIGC